MYVFPISQFGEKQYWVTATIEFNTYTFFVYWACVCTRCHQKYSIIFFCFSWQQLGISVRNVVSLFVIYIYTKLNTGWEPEIEILKIQQSYFFSLDGDLVNFCTLALSYETCNAANRICLAPCKWWLNISIIWSLNVQLVPFIFFNCPLLVVFFPLSIAIGIN